MHIETLKVQRDNLIYKVHVYQDEDSENPRDYGHGQTDMFVRSYHGHDIVEDDTRSGDALYHFLKLYGFSDSDTVENAFNKWRIITGNTEYKLYSGTKHGYVQSEWFDWFLIVNTKVDDNPDELAANHADTYAKWRFGDVELFQIEAPDGEIFDGCGGFYDLESMKEHYIPSIDCHYDMLVTEANRNSAGFIGVI